MITKEQLLDLQKNIEGEAKGFPIEKVFYPINSRELLQIIELAYCYLDLE